MQFIQEVVVAVIAGYLALTMSIADGILALVSSDPDADDTITQSEQPVYDFFTELPSQITNIPDILLNSAAYQKATVIGSDGFVGPTASQPIDAIVNIFCTLTTPDYVRTTTGTGFFIDADGVILTNAHVAQFLLLEESDAFGDAECIIRSGNPASPSYIAELLYISPAWIAANANVIHDATPLGTGERDYALLYVSTSMTRAPLPTHFPALAFDTELLSTSIRESEVTAAGYPAADLIRNGADAELIPRQADTTISELYTFGSNYADLIAIRGTNVGEQGASGGPVVDAEGDVIGMIVTRGDDAVDGAGSLRAITMAHIEATIEEETGFDLRGQLRGNFPERSNIFAQTMTPFLVSLLESGAAR